MGLTFQKIRDTAGLSPLMKFFVTQHSLLEIGVSKPTTPRFPWMGQLEPGLGTSEAYMGSKAGQASLHSPRHQHGNKSPRVRFTSVTICEALGFTQTSLGPEESTVSWISWSLRPRLGEGRSLPRLTQ